MSAIKMKSYAESGLVSVEVVNALLAFGEPMLSETPPDGPWLHPRLGVAELRETRDLPPAPAPPPRPREYRAWVRLRGGGRVMGHPWHSTPQFAATALLAKLEGRR